MKKQRNKDKFIFYHYMHLIQNVKMERQRKKIAIHAPVQMEFGPVQKCSAWERNLNVKMEIQRCKIAIHATAMVENGRAPVCSVKRFQ